MEIPQSLYDKALLALKNAYMPYSNFPVGAAIMSTEGNIYSGCNVENAAYPLCQCAEGNAIAAMICAGDKEIKEALIIIPGDRVCSPCGACRQKLLEFCANDDVMIHLCTTTGEHEVMSIKSLMPHAFDKSFLEIK